jgi:hypothetical protein
MLLLHLGVLILPLRLLPQGVSCLLTHLRPVQTTVVSTPSTSGSGLIPSSAMTTAPFTQSATGPPFSYGMPDFDSNSVLTYSTLQTMGLGAGSSNLPCKGLLGAPQSPLMLSLTVGVTYLLHPPRSVMLSSNLSGRVLTTTCLEQAV